MLIDSIMHQMGFKYGRSSQSLIAMQENTVYDSVYEWPDSAGSQAEWWLLVLEVAAVGQFDCTGNDEMMGRWRQNIWGSREHVYNPTHVKKHWEKI